MVEYVVCYLVGQCVIGVVGYWISGISLVVVLVYYVVGVIQVMFLVMSCKLMVLFYLCIFCIIFNNESIGCWFVCYVVDKLGVCFVVIIDDCMFFGQGLVEQFVCEVEVQGGKVLVCYNVSDKIFDFNVLLMQVCSFKLDLIFFGGLDWQVGVLVKFICWLKLEVCLMVLVGILGLFFFMCVGFDVNGVLVFEFGLLQDKMFGWWQFCQCYSEVFDFDIDFYVVFVYEVVQFILLGLCQVGIIDLDLVVWVMYCLCFEGVSGLVVFNEEGDLFNLIFILYEVQDQCWVLVMCLYGFLCQCVFRCFWLEVVFFV